MKGAELTSDAKFFDQEINQFHMNDQQGAWKQRSRKNR